MTKTIECKECGTYLIIDEFDEAYCPDCQITYRVNKNKRIG